MMWCAPLVLALSAVPSNVGLAVTKLSGVSKAEAARRAALVREKLQLVEVLDLVACQNRLPCLLKEARGRQWTALVALETASVLGDAIVDVKVLSVEEDGRELARSNVQVAEARLGAALDERLSDVRRALAELTAPAPAPRVDPPPPAEQRLESSPQPPTASAPTPSAAARVTPEPPRGERPAARWVPLGVALALGVLGAVGLGISESVAAQLRTARLDQTQIDQLVASGDSWRTAGLVGVVGGGALAAASLILALAWPTAPVAPVAFWHSDARGLAFSGVFP